MEWALKQKKMEIATVYKEVRYYSVVIHIQLALKFIFNLTNI